jgi:bifunctional non-homologous end joining protein LigD
MAKRQQVTIGEHTVELSNLNRIYFPGAGYTKGDLIQYYRQIADTMLPYLAGRPLTLHRFPEGIGEAGFYQQQISDYFPDWIDRVTVEKEGGTITHVVCNNAATLVYLANQGVITPHVWLSRVDKLDYPDRMILDLDPPDAGARGLRRAARAARDLLLELGLTPYLMSTGSTGLHVIVVLDRSQDFETVRAFARDYAGLLAARYPKLLTVEQRKHKRGRRIFLDTLRNSYAHTGVSPYAVRAKPGAPVATPLDWSELDSSAFHPQRYTIKNIFRRLGQKHDPWHDMASHASSLVEARTRLDKWL